MFKLYLLLWVFMMMAPSLQAPTPTDTKFKTFTGEPPIVIGHRGSGIRPSHTLEGYLLAIENGANYIEPDLVMTKDGYLICRHEPMLGWSTDVASHPEFSSKKTTKTMDGYVYTDWFAGDFTLEEIRQLRGIQDIRSRPQKYNGLFSIPTLEEAIAFVKSKSEELNITIGIYPETKRPLFHEKYGLHITEKLLEVLENVGWNHYDAPVYIQSFEVSNLQYIRERSTVKIMQLIVGSGVSQEGKPRTDGDGGKPYDFIAFKDPRTFVDLATDKGLDFIKTYATGIAVWKPYIIPWTYLDNDNNGKADDLNGDGKIDSRDYIRLPPTDLVSRAHAKGLIVHVWTFKDEESSLLRDYDESREEYEDFYDLGIDGVLTDHPTTAVAAILSFKSNIIKG